jgi:hypothetical protein
MAYSWQDGGSSSSGTKAAAPAAGGYSWAGGGTGKATKKRKADDPGQRLKNELGRIDAILPSLKGGDREQALRIRKQVAQGVESTSINDAMVRRMITGQGHDIGKPIASLGGKVLKQVSRPAQAVISTVGEYARESEAASPINVGPLRLHFAAPDVGKLGGALRGGWNLQRHESPTEIITESLAEREKRTGRKGVIGSAYQATARTVPGTKLITDLAVGAVLDPLTYVTFGTSSLTKRGLEGVADLEQAGMLASGTKSRLVAGGLDTLTGPEVATINRELGQRTVDNLARNARGGVGVRVPFRTEVGRTILPTHPVTDPIAQGARAAARKPFFRETSLASLFSPRAKLTEAFGPDVSRQYYEAKRASMAGAEAATEGDIQAMVAASGGAQKSQVLKPWTWGKREGARLSTEELRTQVGPALEQKGGLAALDPRLGEGASGIDFARRDLHHDLVEAGVAKDPDILNNERVHAIFDKQIEIAETQAHADNIRLNAQIKADAIPVLREVPGGETAVERVGTRAVALERAQQRVTEAEATFAAAERAGATADELAARASEVAEAHEALDVAGQMTARSSDYRSLFGGSRRLARAEQAGKTADKALGKLAASASTEELGLASKNAVMALEADAEAGLLHGPGFSSLDADARKVYRAAVAESRVADASGRLRDAADSVARNSALEASKSSLLWGKRLGAAERDAAVAASAVRGAEGAAEKAVTMLPKLEDKADIAQIALDGAKEKVQLKFASEQYGSFARGERAGKITKLGEVRARSLEVEANRMAKELSDMVAEHAEGLITNDVYVPHILTKEGAEWMAANQGAASKYGSMQPGLGGKDRFMQHRDLRMSVDEVNAEVRAAGGPEQFFMEDPIARQAIRSRVGRAAIAGRNFVKKIATLTDAEGNPMMRVVSDLPDAPPATELIEKLRGTKEIPEGWQHLELPGLGVDGATLHVVAPAELHAELTQVAKMGTAEGALEMYDSFLNWWKAMATVPLPFGMGFHLRNATSNVALNWLSGVGVRAEDYVSAFYLQRKLARGVAEGDRFKYLNSFERTATETAERNGVRQTGILGQKDELARDLTEQRAVPFGARTGAEKWDTIRNRGIRFWSRDSYLLRGSTKFGSYVEENAALAHMFAAQRNMGAETVGAWDRAASSAKTWLFDYGDLTPFEQAGMKRIMPFYTYTRKVLPRVFEAMVRDPRKLAQFERARTSLESSGPDLSGIPVPEYLSRMPGSFGANMPWLSKYPVVVAPDTPFDIPFEQAEVGLGLLGSLPGLNKLGLPGSDRGWQNFAQTEIGQIGGPAGLPLRAAETVMGQAMFSGAPIRNEWVPAPRGINFIPGLTSRRLIDGEEKAAVSAKTAYMLNSVIPLLPKLEGLWPYNPQNQEKQARRILSTSTGVPAYPLGPKTIAAEEYRRLEVVDQFWRDLLARSGIEKPALERGSSSSSGGAGYSWSG